ncbi:MAG: hypothetical protein ACE5FF_12195 [Saprospiraceae bacterium]
MNRTLIIPHVLLFCLAATGAISQDTLVFENQWRYPVVVEEEHEQEVIYRKPGIVNSPLYIIEKRFITNISYQDPEAGKALFKPTPPNARKLDVWVTSVDSKKPTKGLMLHLDDTTLQVRQKIGILKGSGGAKTELVRIFPYQKIHKIEIRRRNQIRQYALWGAAGGFITGTLTGLLFFKNAPPCDSAVIDGVPCDQSLGTPFNKWEKSFLLGFGAAGGGFLTGGAAGAIRITFLIGGKKDNFNQTIPKLRRQARLQR